MTKRRRQRIKTPTTTTRTRPKPPASPNRPPASTPADESPPFDPAGAAEHTFLPLADPDRRAADPIRALRAARDLRVLLARAETDAATHARAQRHSWTEIGHQLAISKQAAQQRLGPLTASVNAEEPN